MTEKIYAFRTTFYISAESIDESIKRFQEDIDKGLLKKLQDAEDWDVSELSEWEYEQEAIP